MYRRALYPSSVQLDGRHTLAKNGGVAIGYRAAKPVAPPTPCFSPTTKAYRWPWAPGG
jgi:hypothetical protein